MVAHPSHVRCVKLIHLANDVDALDLSFMRCHYLAEHEASPACARSVLIEGRLPSKYISLHAPVGYCSCQLSLFNSFYAYLATVIPLSPTISRNGSFSVSRYLPNRSKALLQVIDYRGICPAWAKGLAARMLPTFGYTSPSTHCPWGFSAR